MEFESCGFKYLARGRLGVDLKTTVIDWPVMRDFQLACFKSGLPNLDIPQDHTFWLPSTIIALKIT